LSVDELRQLMRQRRRAMGLGAQKHAAFALARHVLKTKAYQNSKHIAFYLACDGEIDVGALLKKAWSQGKACYLPVIDGNRLLFVNYTPVSILEPNGYGIMEPVSGGLIEPRRLDLVLTPLVAFDNHNHRIGMGGGFYDRTFESSTIRHSVFMMGVAHQCQRVRDIKPQPWDVMLDQVVTDRCRPS
jgi:5-formyltetrahydrofolate cyclo-ligase